MSQFNPQPKDQPIRSQKLRDAAKDCPHCMSCKQPNDGTVVGCHAPAKLHRGGGMGYKGHDLLAYCCKDCHDVIDNRTLGASSKSRDEIWLDAFYWSTVWLIQSGVLK